MKIWQLVCGSVLVLSMTSCGDKAAVKPPTETATAPEAAPATAPAPEAAAPKATAPEAAAPTATATGSGFPALKAVVATTKKAADAANFDLATTEFSKFEEAWKSVEDKVKTKTPANYKDIETTVEEANMAIATKNKTTLLASLTKLNGFIDKASK